MSGTNARKRRAKWERYYLGVALSRSPRVDHRDERRAPCERGAGLEELLPVADTLAQERREKWDRYYLGMAQYVATASKDPSTKCGAVIVRPNNTIASVGYNGFPRGMPDDPELYADRPTKYSRIVHAEMNAILNAQCSVDGCTLYVTLTPCDRCAVFIAQAGIRRVVCQRPTPDQLERWADSFNKTEEIFSLAGIQIDYEEYHV